MKDGAGMTVLPRLIPLADNRLRLAGASCFSPGARACKYHEVARRSRGLCVGRDRGCGLGLHR